MAFIEGEKIRLGDSSPKPSSLVYLSVVGSQSQQSPRKPFKIQHMSTFFFFFKMPGCEVEVGSVVTKSDFRYFQKKCFVFKLLQMNCWPVICKTYIKHLSHERY